MLDWEMWRGLDGNDPLYEQLLCESQQQFSWRQTHANPTQWISSRGPARLGISLGMHFLEGSYLELRIYMYVGPLYTNVRGYLSTNK